MNRKGFTLIELIVTIALLGFVGVVLTTNIAQVINRQKINEEEQALELLEEAGCAYTISTCESGCTIEGITLIENGLIDEEINGISMEDYEVSVTYTSDGEKICSGVKK